MRKLALWGATVILLSASIQDRTFVQGEERPSATTAVRASAPSGAAWTDAQRQEFRDRLARSANTPQESYDLLKRSLLEGHFEEVRTALDQRDPNGSYHFAGHRFAGLQARCARAIFLLYARQANPLGWPSDEQGIELRRLARNATAAYEEAFQLAPSDFERACVYARWHELHTRSRFEADSLLLRGGSPLERTGEPVSEALAQQVSQLRAAAAPILDTLTPRGQPMGQEAKNRFLDVFAEEYQKLGRIGVPEDVFAELLDDLPTFLQRAIHPAVLVDPVKNRVTVEYHIWYALTGPRPDGIDNEFIDRYIQNVDRCLYEKSGGRWLEYEPASKAFLALVELERGNRFIPRLKEPLWPYEWSQARDKYQKSMEDGILERIDRAAEGPLLPMPQSLPAEIVQSRMREHAATSIRLLTANLMLELSSYHSFAHGQQPPSVTDTSGGGTTHDDSNVWVYTLRQGQPIPPYPWKKSITATDSLTASTRQMARRVLRALGEKDMATLDTLTVESKGFSRRDGHRLAQRLADGGYAAASQSLDDANDILIEKPGSWSAVRIRTPGREDRNTLILVLRWKDGAYSLAWAGMAEKESPRPLARVLEQLKPGLELPVPPVPVKVLSPAAVAFVDDLTGMESLERLDAGYGWRVQLALTAPEHLSPLELLCCRAEWIDANRPAKAVPFGRYAARHLGPVLWTIQKDGFREKAPDSSGNPAPPMSLQGGAGTYAAVLSVARWKEAYVQVYGAFDGRELARQRISLSEASAWPWGRFMACKASDPFGVSPDFQAAAPRLPAFRPVPSWSAQPTQGKGMSLILSLEDGFFSLRADKRILPARGSRLLARWWLNDAPVLPQAAAEAAPVTNVHAEGLAALFRLPAGLPLADLHAKAGDRIGLQVMLCPDRLESPSVSDAGMQNVVGPDGDETPTGPVLSNRIDFQVGARILVPPSPKAPTAGAIKDFTDAIKQQDVRAVRRLVAEYPELAEDRAGTMAGAAAVGSPGVRGGVSGAGGPRRTGQSALDLVCRHRPQARYVWRWKIGGHTPPAYWKDMGEIAGILIDYGADVNARAQMNQTPLLALLSSLSRWFGRPLEEEDAAPVELLAVLLERGADVNTSDDSPRGTVLRRLVEEIQAGKSRQWVPIVETLLRHGADPFAVEEPWQHESVFEQINSPQKQVPAELAALIRKYGEEGHAARERAVRLGVEELLAGLRNADAKALTALNQELPWARGLDLLRLGRLLQEQFGPALERLGRIDQFCIRGTWAEVLLPTGQPGDRANLYIVLARYPGGAYHAVQAGFADTRAAGARLQNAQIGQKDLTNAVYSAFGRMEACEVSGGLNTKYPDQFRLLSIANERGRLVARGLNLPSGYHFHAELTSAVVFLWRGDWELDLGRAATFATDDRQLSLTNGAMTVQHGDRTMVFRRHEDKVQLEQGGQERLALAFVLDLQTLEVK